MFAGENLEFILDAMKSMVPSWRPKTFFKDGKLSPDVIRGRFPNLEIGIHLCTFHMFRFDLPLALGKVPEFENIKQHLLEMKDARDESRLSELWAAFKLRYV